jgi:hypothetical protein
VNDINDGVKALAPHLSIITVAHCDFRKVRRHTCQDFSTEAAMSSRAVCLGILTPLVLIASACRDEPVRPNSAPVNASVASQASPRANGNASSPAVDIYRVRLSPLNGSDVHGTATLTVTGDELIVRLQAVGHVPDMTHAQHIHGFTDGTDASCPPPEVAGEDGVLTFEEGLPFYGPVQLLLSPFPAPANSAGSIQYHASFAGADLAFAPSDLELKTMVLHGDFVGDEFVGSLPVACGVVERVN